MKSRSRPGVPAQLRPGEAARDAPELCSPTQPGRPRPEGSASGGPPEPKQASPAQPAPSAATANKATGGQNGCQAATATQPIPAPPLRAAQRLPARPLPGRKLAGAIPVWDPPPPPQPKQSLFARLGFGKKTERLKQLGRSTPYSRHRRRRRQRTQPPSPQPVTSEPMSPAWGRSARQPQQPGKAAAAMDGGSPQAGTQQQGLEPNLRPGGATALRPPSARPAGLTAAAALPLPRRRRRVRRRRRSSRVPAIDGSDR